MHFRISFNETGRWRTIYQAVRSNRRPNHCWIRLIERIHVHWEDFWPVDVRPATATTTWWRFINKTHSWNAWTTFLYLYFTWIFSKQVTMTFTIFSLPNALDRLSNHFCVCVCACVSVNRSAVKRLRLQFFTDFTKFACSSVMWSARRLLFLRQTRSRYRI